MTENTVIYLWVNSDGWREFKIGDKSELEKRNIYISDYANIGHYAKIGHKGNPKCLFLTGSQHSVAYWNDDKIQIGCKQYSIKKWKEIYASVGLGNNYSASEIIEYKNYIDIVEAYHLSLNNG